MKGRAPGMVTSSISRTSFSCSLRRWWRRLFLCPFAPYMPFTGHFEFAFFLLLARSLLAKALHDTHSHSLGSLGDVYPDLLLLFCRSALCMEERKFLLDTPSITVSRHSLFPIYYAQQQPIRLGLTP